MTVRCPYCLAGGARLIGRRYLCSTCKSGFGAESAVTTGGTATGHSDPRETANGGEATPGRDGDGVWIVDLPITRPMSLNDRGLHPAVKAQRVAAIRGKVAELVAEAQVPRCDHVEVVLVYTPPDRRRRDPLNLVATLKACEDGVVDAGVVPDDTPEYLTPHMPVIAAPVSKCGRLSLVIRSVQQVEVEAYRRRVELLSALVGHPAALITAEQAREALGITPAKESCQ